MESSTSHVLTAVDEKLRGSVEWVAALLDKVRPELLDELCLIFTTSDGSGRACMQNAKTVILKAATEYNGRTRSENSYLLCAAARAAFAGAWIHSSEFSFQRIYSQLRAASKLYQACGAILFFAGPLISPANASYTVPRTPHATMGHMRFRMQRRGNADNDAATFLHLCACNGLDDVCAELLDSGLYPDPDVTSMNPDKSVETPLYLAAFNRHVDAVRALVSRGASIFLPEPSTSQPMDRVQVDQPRVDSRFLGPGRYAAGGPCPTKELIDALQGPHKDAARAHAVRFFAFAAAAARELGALAVQSDVLPGGALQPLGVADALALRDIMPGSEMNPQGRRGDTRATGISPVSTATAADMAGIYDPEQYVPPTGAACPTLPLLESSSYTCTKKQAAKRMFTAMRARQRRLLGMIEYLDAHAGPKHAVSRPRRSTRVHADAYKITVMEDRFGKALAHLRPGSEGALVARNSRGATPLHYPASAVNDGGSDARLWVSLALFALAEREEQDLQEWVREQKKMLGGRSISVSERDLMIEARERGSEEESRYQRWQPGGLSVDEVREASRGMQELARHAEDLLLEATGAVLAEAADPAELSAAGAARSLDTMLRFKAPSGAAITGCEYRVSATVERKADHRGMGARMSTAMSGCAVALLKGELTSIRAAAIHQGSASAGKLAQGQYSLPGMTMSVSFNESSEVGRQQAQAGPPVMRLSAGHIIASVRLVAGRVEKLICPDGGEPDDALRAGSSSGARAGAHPPASSASEVLRSAVRGTLTAIEELAAVTSCTRESWEAEEIGALDARLQSSRQALLEVVRSKTGAAPGWVRGCAALALSGVKQGAGMAVAHCSLGILAENSRGPTVDAYLDAMEGKGSAAETVAATPGKTRVASGTSGSVRPAAVLSCCWIRGHTHRTGLNLAGYPYHVTEDGPLLEMCAALAPQQMDVIPSRAVATTRGPRGFGDSLVVSEAAARYPTDDPLTEGFELDAAVKRLVRAHPQYEPHIATCALMAATYPRLKRMLLKLAEFGTADPFYVALLVCKDSKELSNAAQLALPEAVMRRGLDGVAALLAAGASADRPYGLGSSYKGRPIQWALARHASSPDLAMDILLLLLMNGAKLRHSFTDIPFPRAHINRHRMCIGAAAARGAMGRIPHPYFPLHVAALPGDDRVLQPPLAATKGDGTSSATELNAHGNGAVLLQHLQAGIDEACSNTGVDLEDILADLPDMRRCTRAGDFCAPVTPGMDGIEGLSTHLLADRLRSVKSSELYRNMEALYNFDLRNTAREREIKAKYLNRGGESEMGGAVGSAIIPQAYQSSRKQAYQAAAEESADGWGTGWNMDEHDIGPDRESRSSKTRTSSLPATDPWGLKSAPETAGDGAPAADSWGEWKPAAPALPTATVHGGLDRNVGTSELPRFAVDTSDHDYAPDVSYGWGSMNFFGDSTDASTASASNPAMSDAAWRLNDVELPMSSAAAAAAGTAASKAAPNTDAEAAPLLGSVGTSAHPSWLYAGIGERGEAAQIRAMVHAAYTADHDRYLRCVHAMGRWRAWRFWLRGPEDRARRLVEFRRAVAVRRRASRD